MLKDWQGCSGEGCVNVQRTVCEHVCLGQVGGECYKYGTVTRVLIFEVTEPGFPADQAVRIFIEFDRPESATKALVDLEGRFFGGRTVRATFFDEGKFERQELAPVPGEQM